MPSLLVLGGTGFIGRHIINKAVSKKWKVTSASLSLPDKKKRIKKVEYYKVDLKDFSIVKKKLVGTPLPAGISISKLALPGIQISLQVK